MRPFILIALVLLTACSWLGSRKPAAAPGPTEIIITGAPVGAQVLVDGLQVGGPIARNDASEIIRVAPGLHKVEISLSGAIVYREDTYAGPGEHRVVSVLSGLNR